MYVGMAAAAARAEQLDSIADNLANVETPGFKASHAAFQSFLPPRAGKMADKISTAAVDTGTNLSRGTILTTENPLDVVPQEDGFLMVQTPSGPAYTRNGRMTISPDGILMTAGQPVIGTSGNVIQIPLGTKPQLNQLGSVIVDNQELDRLAVFNLQGNIRPVGPSLYGPGPGGAATPTELGVSIGQLEMGNATALDATVQMIGAQRQFETAMQAIQTYRKLDEQAVVVGRSR